jgi:hypothetical protein
MKKKESDMIILELQFTLDRHVNLLSDEQKQNQQLKEENNRLEESQSSNLINQINQ